MRTTNHVWKRLLSLALALVMLLGYIPAKASAEKVNTGNLLYVMRTTTTTGGEPVSGSTTGETTPQMHSYSVVVEDKNRTDITNDPATSIVWSADGMADVTGPECGPLPADVNVTATVTYKGIVVTNTSDEIVPWAAHTVGWTITAGDTIAPPELKLDNWAASFATDPVWEIKDENGNDVKGQVATVSMGKLTATTQIADETITQNATVAAAPINVTGVSLASGWHAAVSDVTVYGSNNTDLANSGNSIQIGGESKTWQETGTGDQKYSVTFMPTLGTKYSIGGSEYTWNVDNEEPTIEILQAIVRKNTSGQKKTYVKYKYSVGPSGGTITCGSQSKTIVGKESGTGEFIFDDPELPDVTVNIENNLVEKKSDSKNQNVVAYPTEIKCAGDYTEEAGTTYIKDSGTISFEMVGGVPNINWTINNGTSDIPYDGSTPLDASDVVDKTLTVTATDGYGRQLVDTFGPFVLDSEDPEIQIEVKTNGSADAPLVTNSWECKISVTDKVKLGSANAELAYVEMDGTESTKDVTLNLEADQQPNTISLADIPEGATLTKITVTAVDWADNSANAQTVTPYVTKDTTSPSITATISATASDGSAVNIKNIYETGGKTYLMLDPAVADGYEAPENYPDVTVTVTYTLTDDNLEGDPVRTDEITVKRDEVVELSLLVTGEDKAGNKADQENITISVTDLAKIVLNKTANPGEYVGSVSIDRRSPEDASSTTGAPVVSLGLENEDANYPGEDGLRRFKSDITFTMHVTDSGSGLPLTGSEYKHSVTYKVGETTETKDVTLDADGKGSVTIPVDSGIEDENCTVTLTIMDNVGNRYIYNETFAVDSKAPNVTIDGKNLDEFALSGVSNEAGKKLTLHMEDTYPAESKVILTIENPKDTSRTKDHEVKLENGTDVTFSFADGDQLKKIVISAKDQLDNEPDPKEKKVDPAFVYDLTPPEIAFSDVKAVDTSNPLQSNEVSENVTYYNQPVQLTVTVSDDYLLNVDNCTGTYKIDGEEMTLNFEATGTDGKTATATITVEAGKTLTDLKVTATDEAGTPKDASYGKTVAVDSDIPKVTVTKASVKEMVQTVGDKDYYDDTVTFTFEVTDQFIDTKNTVVTALVNGDPKSWQLETTSTDSKPVTTLTGTIILDKSATLTGITVVAKDMFGNFAEEVVAGEGYTFGKDATNKGTFNYEGNNVVVDMTDPEATLMLTGNVKSVQVIKDTYYVTLNNAVAGENGTFTGEKEEPVTLTLTVTDDNLMLQTDKNELQPNTFPEGKINDAVWTLNGNTATLTATVAVPINDSALLTIDAKAFDLAGNAISVNKVKCGGNENEGGWLPLIGKENAQEGDAQEDKADGTVKGVFSVDRRTPSSTEDNEVPQIKLSDNNAPKVKTLSGMDLYSAGFNFSVSVTDGQAVSDIDNKEKYYAGLGEVKTELSDEAGKVTEAVKDSPYDAEVHQLDHSEDIAVNGSGETDDAILNITATDNVGNTIHYFKNFAFDNLAPRITVNVSETSVRGNQYYNQTRVATVTIEDLHMPEIADFDNYVTVNTQVGGSGWVKDGNTYTNSYTFSNDGEYTFSIQAKDLAGNSTTNADVTYIGENTQDFIVDKTNPVITVVFTPAAPSGRDEKNVAYYAENVTASVTINERNFNAADVAARFVGGDRGLGNWTGEENHRSSVTFGEGNNYSFTVDFVDLAGNRADGYRSPTFSVDLTAPTVTISKGTLKNDGLNIIQGDLDLGITVNDAQQNLSDYTVTVTRLNNNFKSEELTGGDYYTVTTEEERTTVVVNFNAIARDKGNDGIYTVKVSATDYAGNAVQLTPELQFSLNRFGSTFTTNDKFTEDFLTLGQYEGAYHNSVENKLVIQEINPNMVWQDSSKKKEGSTLTVVVNGTSTQLEEGKHYTMSRAKEGAGENSWYVYTYEIDPDAFRMDGEFVDGRYSILLYGEDDAGNKNTNESNESSTLQKNADGEYTGKIEFTLDTTPPIITTTGVEDGKTYNEEFRRMNIFLSDNTPYQIAVYLNDTPVVLSESAEGLTNSEAWLVWDETVGGYVLNVPEQNTLFGNQNVRVVATDAAGNSAEHAVEEFHITTNLFVRLINSVWFIVALLLVLLLAAGFIVLLLVKRRRKANV